MLLRSILSALDLCNTTRCADRALDVFLVVHRNTTRTQNCGGLPSPPAPVVTLWPSMSMLRASLCIDWQPDTSPEKYDQLMDLFARSTRIQGMPLTLAELALYHPADPDADPLLSLCQRDMGLQIPQIKTLLDRNFRYKTRMRRLLYRAIAILHSYGRQGDAEWLSTFKRNVFGMEEADQSSTSGDVHFPGSLTVIRKISSSIAPASKGETPPDPAT